MRENLHLAVTGKITHGVGLNAVSFRNYKQTQKDVQKWHFRYLLSASIGIRAHDQMPHTANRCLVVAAGEPS